MEIIRPLVHYSLHFLAPGLIAWLFFRKNWKQAWLIMLATMLVDLDRNLRAAAPLIFEIAKHINQTYDELWDDGQIQIPIPPDRAYQEGRQQVKWYTYGLLEGKPYQKEELQQNLEKQVEDRTGQPVSSLPPETQEQLEESVDDIWGMVSLVGAEAKVVTKKE